MLFLKLRRWVRRLMEPSFSPRTFLRHRRSWLKGRTVVVCAGDSITHGVVSANYVALLRARWMGEGYTFVNGGINGELAYNLLRRLDTVIACRPDVLTLLIGTNDVNATFSAAQAEQYRRNMRLPQLPSLDWYCGNVALILDRLQAETSARIAVLSLPPLGEDLDSAINRRVLEYNAALRHLAAERGVLYLPLHERLAALLPSGHHPPPYAGKLGPIFSAVLQHDLLRRSWDDISARRGVALLTDHIHLNERAAGVVADLIGDFLRAKTPAA